MFGRFNAQLNEFHNLDGLARLLLCLPRQLPFPPLPSYLLYQKTKKNSLHTGTAPWQRSVTRLLLFS